MHRSQKTYNFFDRASSIFMMLALLWLTVSIPFVVASQQEIGKPGQMEKNHSPSACNEEEAANPFGNTTEEKAPGGSSVSEEYLHDNHTADYFQSIASQNHKCENSGIYNAFHGEVHVPPPNLS